jgi:hypothetical protein
MDRLIARYLALPAGFRVFVAALAVMGLIAAFVAGC